MASAVLRMTASCEPLLMAVLLPQPQPTSGTRPTWMSQKASLFSPVFLGLAGSQALAIDVKAP